LLTLLDVILKQFYFTIMTLLGALVVLLHLGRRNLDFLDGQTDRLNNSKLVTVVVFCTVSDN